MAFQAMAVPTTAPAVGSWFGHAELSSYLGSMFTLANTAGELFFIRSCLPDLCCMVGGIDGDTGADELQLYPYMVYLWIR